MADEHPNKHIREAVDLALRKGWRLEKAGSRSHLWGMLYCTQRDRQGCRRAVYSTPRCPEDHAKDIRRAVARCPHDEELQTDGQ